MSTYNGFTIHTQQDSLGDYHFSIDDPTGQTVASGPDSDEYGYNTQQKAEAQAKRVVTKYINGYQ